MTEPVVYEDVSETKVQPYVGMTMRDFLRVLVTGAIVGIATFALYYLLNRFVFGAVLCRSESTGDCAQAPSYAMAVALLVGAIGGVVGLAHIRVYRPLLVVIATAISYWGIHTLIQHMAWYMGLLDVTVLFALAYAAFTWIARIRSFILALVVTIVLVVAVRWVLIA